ncbi:MAG: arginase [Bacteroidota bacterium]
MDKIKIVEINSEIGAGTRGASMGIDALKIASINQKSSFFTLFPKVEVKTENEVLFQENHFPHAKFIDAIYRTDVRVSKAIAQTLSQGFFPLVLAGDHSTAAGTLAGIKLHYPNKRLGVIWIDAHADLHTPYTTPSGNIHGMPLAIALHLDNRENQINTIDPQTSEYWKRIKEVGSSGSKIKAQDLVYIGVRDVEAQEQALIDQFGIKNFTVAELRKLGVEKVVQQSLDRLSGCDYIYVSFDVDSIDGQILSGTGTPVEDGLYPDEAKELNYLFIQEEKICAWEMVEINPTLDKYNNTAEIAFQILESSGRALHESRNPQSLKV